VRAGRAIERAGAGLKQRIRTMIENRALKRRLETKCQRDLGHSGHIHNTYFTRTQYDDGNRKGKNKPSGGQMGSRPGRER
jgi:hypothetical protein